MLPSNDISILISGNLQSGKALAAILINKALTDSGFSDVKMVSETGQQIPALSVVESILDVVAQGAPDLFKSRVIIQEVKTRASVPRHVKPRETKTLVVADE